MGIDSMTSETDFIDIASGAHAGSWLNHLRRELPFYVEQTEACRSSVLSPEDDRGLSHAFRVAIVARIAALTGQNNLAELYRSRLSREQDIDLTAIAAGQDLSHALNDPIACAIVRHVDLVTQSPARCQRADIESLSSAGLTNPQIVAISELIAFAAYEARVTHGLNLLRVAVDE
jgi:uncharacterized protein YciW